MTTISFYFENFPNRISTMSKHYDVHKKQIVVSLLKILYTIAQVQEHPISERYLLSSAEFLIVNLSGKTKSLRSLYNR